MSSTSLSIDDMFFAQCRREPAKAIGDAITIGLALLNLGGGLAAGLWLAVAGDWAVVVGGVVGGVAMFWAVAKLTAPIDRAPAFSSRAAMPTHWASIAAGIPCELRTAVLISAWTLTVFVSFTQFAERGPTVPLVIWGYAVTLAPLSYLAKSQYGDSLGAHLGLLLAMGAYAMLVVLDSAGAEPVPMAVAALALAVAEGLYCAKSGAAAHGQRGKLRPA